MKKFAILVLALVATVGSAFAAGKDGKADTYNVSASKSSVEWLGEKVTGKHTGTIAIQTGSLEVKNGKLVGGEFVIDMTSIKCTDLSGETAKKLEGHLNSNDFFGTESHKTAKLVITKVKSNGSGKYTVTGDLTIKGQTHSVTFDTTLNEASGKATAEATIKVDRTKYGIRYGSGSFFDNLGDKAISDEFTLTVKLEGTK